MKNQVPKEVRKDIIKKITGSVDSKDEKKYVILFISQEEDIGLSIKFLSTYNDHETIGLIEKAKLYANDKMNLDEINRTKTSNLIKENVEATKDCAKPNYVS